MLGKSDSPNNRPSNNKTFRAIIKLATTAFAVGVGIGVLTWILASILGIGTNLLWYELRASLDWWFFPLLMCVPAGLLIGIIEKKHHSNPKQFPTIFESIKTLGTYSAGNFGAATLSFMAPLLFGGSVGPGVGIFGLLATFISRFVPQFRTMSMHINESCVVRVGDKGDKAEIRLAKKTRYSIAALIAAGFAFSMALSIHFLGWHLYFPRFEIVEITPSNLLWALLAIPLSYAIAFALLSAASALTRVAMRYQRATIQKSTICGIMLGLAGIEFPMLLCTGQVQSFELMEAWSLMSCSALFALGLAKLFITPLCISLGWGGGPFFPVILGCLSIGYGIAAISGTDPIMLTAIFSAAILTSTTKQPVLVVILMLLCFSLECLPFLIVSALIFSKVPFPKARKTKSTA